MYQMFIHNFYNIFLDHVDKDDGITVETFLSSTFDFKIQMNG